MTDLTYETFWKAVNWFEEMQKKKQRMAKLRNKLCGYRTFGRLEIGWNFMQFCFGFNYYPGLSLKIFIGFFRVSFLS